MNIYRFDSIISRPIQQYGSQKASVTPVGISESAAQVHCIYLESGGVLGLHPAGSNQLFLVVQGQGWVRCGDSPETPVHAGQAVFWRAGELHETHSQDELVALVIEAEGLQPSKFLANNEVKGP
jgi:quercetin dioxygenase-like cupin family protein